MKLTPAQFRDALGLTQETLRHWRRVLPPFQGVTGYAPVFTTGDLIAGAVIKTLVDTCGISVSKFAKQATSIAATCNETPWIELSKSVLILSLKDATCALAASSTKTMQLTPSVSIPLSPILEGLTQAMMCDTDDLRTSRAFDAKLATQQESRAES